MKKIKQKASKKRLKNLKVYREKISAWTQLEAVKEFKESFPDVDVVRVSAGSNPAEAWKKPVFKVTYKKLKAKYKCFKCKNSVFKPCFIDGRIVCSQCYFEAKSKNNGKCTYNKKYYKVWVNL